MDKIMFSDRFGLTDATISRIKTQTRRIIPRMPIDKIKEFQLEYYNATFDWLDGAKLLEQYYIVEGRSKPPYLVGQTVAVAQRYCDVLAEFPSFDQVKCYRGSAGYTNKMFVIADLMPHQITFTGLRIERLQDISNEDCIKEGIRVFKDGMACFDDKEFPGRSNIYHSPREAYSVLIDYISGRGTWKANPWVYVYDYELVN